MILSSKAPNSLLRTEKTRQLNLSSLGSLWVLNNSPNVVSEESIQLSIYTGFGLFILVTSFGNFFKGIIQSDLGGGVGVFLKWIMSKISAGVRLQLLKWPRRTRNPRNLIYTWVICIMHRVAAAIRITPSMNRKAITPGCAKKTWRNHDSSATDNGTDVQIPARGTRFQPS